MTDSDSPRRRANRRTRHGWSVTPRLGQTQRDASPERATIGDSTGDVGQIGVVFLTKAEFCSHPPVADVLAQTVRRAAKQSDISGPVVLRGRARRSRCDSGPCAGPALAQLF